jgi:glucosamine--fructose-6-phosphate aminotransferase (isomerizing)
VSSSHPLLNQKIESLSIIACGTSYHAGLIGKYIIEQLLGISVRVELGSEFNHFRRLIPTTANIVLTQSGETADVLSAMKRLQQTGSDTLVITNVPGSTASRIANHTIYTKAGPEVSVAATKSFLAQIFVLYKLVLSSPELDPTVRKQLVEDMKQLPSKIDEVIQNEAQIVDCAKYLSEYENAFFIGRWLNFPIALEGALKLKEIAYIRAEGYAAGELKHGPLALLQPDTPVIAIVSPDNTYDVMVSNIKEVKSRESPIIALIEKSDWHIEDLVDSVIRVPHVSSILTPFVNAVALQLLAYHTARIRGCPIDFPRNLAKSVTVE